MVGDWIVIRDWGQLMQSVAIIAVALAGIQTNRRISRLEEKLAQFMRVPTKFSADDVAEAMKEFGRAGARGRSDG